MIKKSGVVFIEECPKEDKSLKPKKTQKKKRGKGQEKSLEEQGKAEAIKNEIKEEEKGKKKLEDIIEASQKTLFKAYSTFPFDFYPDSVKIELNKVIVNNKKFILGSQNFTLLPDDITDVTAFAAIFFASLEFKVKDKDIAGEEQLIKIRFLKPEDAFKAEKIIKGMLMAKKQGIDLNILADQKVEDLIKKFEELGKLSEIE